MFYTGARYRATRTTPLDDRLPYPRGRRKKASLKLPPQHPLPQLSVSRVYQPI